MMLVSAYSCSKLDDGYYHDPSMGDVPMRVRTNLVFITFNLKETPIPIGDFNKYINYDSSLKIVDFDGKPVNPDNLTRVAIVKERDCAAFRNEKPHRQ